MTVVVAVSIPSYRYYTLINDLERAADQVTQGLHQAQLLSELNEHDSPWGFHVASGVVYKGSTYISRDVVFDDRSPLPSTVTPSGLSEVFFAVLTGEPSATGSIILTAANGVQRIITVLGGAGGILGNDSESDFLVICHFSGGSPHSIKIPESAWPAHQKNHGDMLGPCPS